jgi:hypothetical protein
MAGHPALAPRGHWPRYPEGAGQRAHVPHPSPRASVRMDLPETAPASGGGLAEVRRPRSPTTSRLFPVAITSTLVSTCFISDLPRVREAMAGLPPPLTSGLPLARRPRVAVAAVPPAIARRPRGPAPPDRFRGRSAEVPPTAPLADPQEQLAFEADMHRTYVSGVERGIRNPTVKIVSRLASALGVAAAKLLEEKV